MNKYQLQREESGLQRADTVNHFKVLSTFKALKNLMGLMIYHHSLIPLNQYNEKNLVFSVYQFALDTFVQDEDLHSKVHSHFTFALSCCQKEHLLEPVIDHLTSMTFSQFKYSLEARVSIFSRFNLILTQMRKELLKEGEEKIKQRFASQFN
jgi:hypothetical protein